MAEPGKIIVEHSETKERKELTPNQFRAFMISEYGNGDGSQWVVAETGISPSTSDGYYANTAKEMKKKIEYLESSIRGWEVFADKVLIAALDNRTPLE